jgi:hypothetical protein
MGSGRKDRDTISTFDGAGGHDSMKGKSAAEATREVPPTAGVGLIEDALGD